MTSRVLLLVRGDAYRSYRGESVGHDVVEQNEAILTMRTFLVEPLIKRGYHVDVIVDCNCIASLHDMFKETLSGAFQGLTLKMNVQTPETRLPTQHESIADMLQRNQSSIETYSFTVVARVDFHYDASPYPDRRFSNNKILALHPHIWGKATQANDTFWVCPQQLQQAFTGFFTDSKNMGRMLHMPKTLPMEYTTPIKYGTSHLWFNPFYHYVGRTRVSRKEDVKGERVRGHIQ
jgi:hypothetical protein